MRAHQSTLPIIALLLLLYLLGGCGLSGGSSSQRQIRLDSLTHELNMERRLNSQLQAYIEEVCYPKVDPSLRRTASGVPPVSANQRVPDSLPNLKLRPTNLPYSYQLDEPLRFNPTSVSLSEGDQEMLQRVADSLRLRDDLIITVLGHCDNTEENNTDQYPDSWDLSTARAEAVVRQLISSGVSPQYLVAAGRGRFYPIDSNRSRAGQERNRRVEIFIRSRNTGP